MSVDEMIEKVNQLDAEALARLRSAVDRAQAQLEETDEERWQRGDEALERLMRGVGSAGGKRLSEGIDDALYRGDR